MYWTGPIPHLHNIQKTRGWAITRFEVNNFITLEAFGAHVSRILWQGPLSAFIHDFPEAFPANPTPEEVKEAESGLIIRELMNATFAPDQPAIVLPDGP